MILHLKLGRAVKVSLIFVPKTPICNKVAFHASNLQMGGTNGSRYS